MKRTALTVTMLMLLALPMFAVDGPRTAGHDGPKVTTGKVAEEATVGCLMSCQFHFSLCQSNCRWEAGIAMPGYCYLDDICSYCSLQCDQNYNACISGGCQGGGGW